VVEIRPFGFIRRPLYRSGDDSSPRLVIMIILVDLSREFSILLDAVFFQDHNTMRACRIRALRAKVP